MQITVRFDGHHWSIQPDPATVRVGTPIEWRFELVVPVHFPRFRWSAYFDHGSPFGDSTTRLTVVTRGVALATPTPSGTSAALFRHSGTTNAAIAMDPGDYKYGVNVEDPRSNAILGDDDPRLIVRR